MKTFRQILACALIGLVIGAAYYAGLVFDVTGGWAQ